MEDFFICFSSRSLGGHARSIHVVTAAVHAGSERALIVVEPLPLYGLLLLHGDRLLLLLLFLPTHAPQHPEETANRGTLNGVAGYCANTSAEQCTAKQATRRLASVVLLHGLRRRRGHWRIGRIVA